MAKYLLLKHYRGAPAPVNDVPMDRWRPDEVDAHMHPKWQQSIVVHLKQIFPNLQMVVSTHSPLIVSGLTPAEVARFAHVGDPGGRRLLPTVVHSRA